MISENIIIEIDRIKEPYKQIHVKKITQYLKDGVVVSESIHRHVVNPGDDISKESDNVKQQVKLLWNDDIINSYKNKKNKI